MRLVALLVLLSAGLAVAHSLKVSLNVTVRLSDSPAKTPTAPAKTPTAPAKTPTAPAKSPTVPAKKPTEPAKTPTEPAKSPTEPAKKPTVPAKTQTKPPKSQPAPSKTDTVPPKKEAVSPSGETVNGTQDEAERIKETTEGNGTSTNVEDLSLSEAEEVLPSVTNFATDLLSNVSKSLYQEEVETLTNDSDKRITKLDYGTLFKVKLRSSKSNCRKGNKTCSLLKPVSRPEDTRSMPVADYQGYFYMPFIAPLNGTLSPGKTIKIEGRAMTFPETFYVYVRSHTGPAIRYAPLVIRIIYSEDKTEVYFNYVAGGKPSVGNHYNYKGKLKLFGLGERFTIKITLKEKDDLDVGDWYEIKINHKTWRESAKIPYREATHLELNALAYIDNVEGTTEVIQRGLVEARKTPLVLPIHDLPLRKGRSISIGGYIPPGAKLFEIRLQNNEVYDKYLAVVVSLTFDFEKQGLLIRHHVDQKWAEGAWLPKTQWFRPGRGKGQPFYMEFHFEEFRVSLVFHGDWSFKYDYHVPIQSARYLSIKGDLQVDRINGLDTIRDCAADILNLSSKMWAGPINCTDNYYLSYARYGNVPYNS